MQWNKEVGATLSPTSHNANHDNSNKGNDNHRFKGNDNAHDGNQNHCDHDDAVHAHGECHNYSEHDRHHHDGQ